MELAQEPLVVDIETEGLGGGVEIGAVNEQGDFFRLVFHDCSRVNSLEPRHRPPGRGSAGQFEPDRVIRGCLTVCRSIAGARSPSQPIRKYDSKDCMAAPGLCLTEACRPAKENLREEFALHFRREIVT